MNLYYADYTSKVSISNTDWTGAFTVAGTIADTVVLNQLLSTRRLPFDLSVLGDLKLAGARLDLDITDTTPPPAHDVPAQEQAGPTCQRQPGRRRRRQS
jgi:hypothetical protein